MAHSRSSESGSANGVNTLMRSLGTSTSSAVMAAVLASHSTTVGTLVVPAKMSFQLAFGCSAVVAMLAVVLALTTGPPRPRTRPGPLRGRSLTGPIGRTCPTTLPRGRSLR